eukprot:PhM_4_TR2432/c1_g1_i6/m.50668
MTSVKGSDEKVIVNESTLEYTDKASNIDEGPVTVANEDPEGIIGKDNNEDDGSIITDHKDDNEGERVTYRPTEGQIHTGKEDSPVIEPCIYKKQPFGDTAGTEPEQDDVIIEVIPEPAVTSVAANKDPVIRHQPPCIHNEKHLFDTDADSILDQNVSHVGEPDETTRSHQAVSEPEADVGEVNPEPATKDAVKFIQPNTNNKTFETSKGIDVYPTWCSDKAHTSALEELAWTAEMTEASFEKELTEIKPQSYYKPDTPTVSIQGRQVRPQRQMCHAPLAPITTNRMQLTALWSLPNPPNDEQTSWLQWLGPKLSEISAVEP